jgi:hypothetical protein
MAMKALPMLCILSLIFSASLIFPSAEGMRTLEESKDGSNLLSCVSIFDMTP